MAIPLNISFGGGLYCNTPFLQAFYAIRRLHLEWFDPQMKITTIYDTFPSLIWNGGRPHSYKEIAREDKQKMINFFNNQNIGVNFTFSNLLLEEKHLTDKQCNQVLTDFESPLNGCIVATEILAQYIRQTYPQYRLILSVAKTTEPQFDESALQKAVKEYDMVVFPDEYNKDFSFLRNFPADKIELIVDEECPKNCPYTQEHYQSISKYNLAVCEFPEQKHDFIKCKQPKEIKGNALTSEEMRCIYDQTGISHFKFANRTYSVGHTIKTICQYFVLQQYKTQFQSYIQKLIT